jgi:hypothetical protein
MSWFSHLVHSIENVGHDIAKGVKHLAHDVEHGLQHLGHEVSQGIKHLENEIAHGVKAVGHAVSKAITWIGHQIGKGLTVIINGVLRAVGELVGIHMRGLTHDEAGIVNHVFRGKVPTDRILITSVGGLGGSIFTIPGSLIFAVASIVPWFAPVTSVLALVSYLHDTYLINAGAQGFRDGLHIFDSGPTQAEARFNDFENKGGRKGATLVHECTHVWQGVNGAFSWWYVFNSVYHKLGHLKDNHQYDFTPGQQFRDYNVEQQGMIVEEWYVNNERTDDPLFPYIRDNIWPGKPSAFTKLDTPTKRRHLRPAHAH